MPDWWGERLTQRHFEERGIPWKRATVLRKLACQGERETGAQEFRMVLDGGDFGDCLVAELCEGVEAARETRGEKRPGVGGIAEIRNVTRRRAAQGAAWRFGMIFPRPSGPPATGGLWPPAVKFDTEPVLHEEGSKPPMWAPWRARRGSPRRKTCVAGGCGRLSFFHAPVLRCSLQGAHLHLHSYSGLTHTQLRDGLEYADLIRLVCVLTLFSAGRGGDFPAGSVQLRRRQ